MCCQVAVYHPDIENYIVKVSIGSGYLGPMSADEIPGDPEQILEDLEVLVEARNCIYIAQFDTCIIEYKTLKKPRKIYCPKVFRG